MQALIKTILLFVAAWLLLIGAIVIYWARMKQAEPETEEQPNPQQV